MPSFLFNPYVIPPLISTFITLFLSYVIFKHSKDKKFLYLGLSSCFGVIVWQTCDSIEFIAKNSETAVFFARLSYSFIIFMPAFYSEFICYAAVSKTFKVFKYIRILSIVFLPFIWFSNYFIGGAYLYFFGFYKNCDILHFLFIFLTFFIIFYTFYVLINNNNKLNNYRAKSFFISYSLFVICAIDFLPKHGVEIYPVGWFFISASFVYTLYKMFFDSYGEVGIVSEKLRAEVKLAREKVEYLASIFTHDLKNEALASLLLLKNNNSKKDLQNDSIESAYRSIEKIMMVCGNVLNIFTEEEIVLNKEYIKSEDICNSLMSSWKTRFVEKGISFNITFSPGNLYIDKSYMDLTWNNLMANALKNTSENGFFSLKIEQNEVFWILLFRNSGKLIPYALREKMFEKNISLSERSVYSKGLGLHYCKMMTEKHNGFISYNAYENENVNEFIIKLPKKIGKN